MYVMRGWNWWKKHASLAEYQRQQPDKVKQYQPAKLFHHKWILYSGIVGGNILKPKPLFTINLSEINTFLP